MNKHQLQEVMADQLLEFMRPEDLISRDVDLTLHIDQPEVSVITGVRRCGKSTLMKLIATRVAKHAAIFYLDLDDSRLFDFTVADFQIAFSAWLEMQPGTPARIYFFYDELQNVIGWERWVTQLSKNSNYKVFITGSNSNLLSSELASHLTGRHVPIHLGPLSFFEISRIAFGEKLMDLVWRATTIGAADVERIMQRYESFGGFPRAYLGQSTHLLPVYYNDIIEKDILRRHRVRTPKIIHNLGRFLMSDNTKLANRSALAMTLEVKKQSTVTTYCHYFQESFLVTELRAFSFSVRKQVRSLSKYYAVDPVLAKKVGFSFMKRDGVLLENLVFLELQRRGSEIYYWNAKAGYEVDFVTCSGIKISAAIQVTYSLESPKTAERELRALVAARRELNASELLIITREGTEDVLEYDGVKIRVLPFVSWALEGRGPVY